MAARIEETPGLILAISQTLDERGEFARYFVENIFEALDTPGEWYLDRKAQVLYYIPRSGEDMNAAEIVAPVVEKLLELKGSLDEPFAGCALALDLR